MFPCTGASVMGTGSPPVWSFQLHFHFKEGTWWNPRKCGNHFRFIYFQAFRFCWAPSGYYSSILHWQSLWELHLRCRTPGQLQTQVDVWSLHQFAVCGEVIEFTAQEVRKGFQQIDLKIAAGSHLDMSEKMLSKFKSCVFWYVLSALIESGKN